MFRAYPPGLQGLQGLPQLLFGAFGLEGIRYSCSTLSPQLLCRVARLGWAVRSFRTPAPPSPLSS